MNEPYKDESAELAGLARQMGLLLTDRPSLLDHYSVQAGWDTFFSEIAWIGELEDGEMLGYRTGAAKDGDRGPVVMVDTEGSVCLVGVTLADYLAEAGGEREHQGEDHPGFPDPAQRLEEVLAAARSAEPLRPLGRMTSAVAPAEGRVVVCNTDDRHAVWWFDPRNLAFAAPPEPPGTGWPAKVSAVGRHPDGRVVLLARRTDFVPGVSDRGFYRCVLVDPVSGRATAGPEVSGAGVHGRHAVVLDDGRVLLAGGSLFHTNRSIDDDLHCHLYDPVAGVWDRVGDLATAVVDSAMVARPGGALMVGGHHDFRGTSACTRFDAVTGQWHPVAPLPEPAGAPGALELPGGSVLVFNLEDAGAWMVYDPDRDAWSRHRVDERIGQLTKTSVRMGDGRVAFFGTGNGYDVQLLDPVAGEFSYAGTTRINHRYSGAVGTLLSDDRVLLVGGVLFDNITAEPEIWDAATGSSSSLPGLGRQLNKHVTKQRRRLKSS